MGRTVKLTIALALATSLGACSYLKDARDYVVDSVSDSDEKSMGELKPFASDQYWRMANTHYHSVFKDGPMAHEFSVRFEGRDAWYQRLIMPLDGGKQLLMGSWFIDTPTNASAH